MNRERSILGVGKLRVLAERDLSAVVILASVEADFDDVEDRKKSQLIRIMELWCERRRLTPEQFNPNEGRERKGDFNVLLQAFKAHKIRLYGFCVHVERATVFLVADADLAKKQNKADPGLLKRAKGRAIENSKAIANAYKAGKK